MTKKATFEESEAKLLERGLTYLKLLHYEGYSCGGSKFQDLDYIDDENQGIFEGKFEMVLKEMVRYKPRSKAIRVARMKDPENIAKRNATSLEKYGSKCPAQNKKIKDKIKADNLEKFGAEHHWAKESPSRQKRDKTMLSEYGSVNARENKELNQKGIDTSIANWGSGCSLTNAEIKEKAEQTKLERYGTIHPSQTLSIKQRVSKSVRNSMVKSGRFKIIGGVTTGEYATLKGIAKTTAQKIYNANDLELVATYTRYTSYLEQKVKNHLNSLPSIEFICNKTIEGLNRARPDFIIEDYKLIIECDGFHSHSDAPQSGNIAPKLRSYHKDRQETFLKMGYSSLFFRQDELDSKFPIVKSMINNKLNLSSRVFARKCQIVELYTNESNNFFSKNHLMGNGSGQTFALVFENSIVCAIRIAKKKDHINISRFCSRLNTSVIGGLSRLLKYVERTYNPQQVISFVDLRYGDGKSLQDLGFELETNSLSFKWCSISNHQSYHRMNFPGNSGYEAGLYKIWDCGQAKYVKTY
jgi:very-short-patch-repair endonuclease